MSSNPTNDEIMAAIRQSGYLMEQHVATQLETLNFHIRTNVAFEDPDEGKSREIDVSAIKRVAFNESAIVAAFVELIVECKNSNNPLVLITRPKNEGDAKTTFKQFRFPMKYEMRKDLGGGKAMFREISAFSHLGFDKIHYRHLQPIKAVQFCRIDRKGNSWHANHGGLYDAVFYPMAKALTARLAEIPKGSNRDDQKYIWLLFPIVVTAGELLVVDSIKADPVPEQRDWVSFSRELKSGKLSGNYALDFVQQDQLEKFVRECIDPLGELAKELVETKTNLLLQNVCPWQD
jgi:ABC-type transporter Mla MlaB component